MKSLSKYPVLFPDAFIAQQFFSSSGSLILGEQIVHIEEFEDQLALSNNKPNFQLTPVLLFVSTIQLPRFTFLFSFSVHHENHHRSLHNHIFIVFPFPPPPLSPPNFFCNTSLTSPFLLFSLLYHHNAHFSTNV